MSCPGEGVECLWIFERVSHIVAPRAMTAYGTFRSIETADSVRIWLCSLFLTMEGTTRQWLLIALWFLYVDIRRKNNAEPVKRHNSELIIIDRSPLYCNVIFVQTNLKVIVHMK